VIVPRVIPLGAIALLMFPPAADAQVSVHCAPETASLFVYEPFTLRLDVESDAPPATPVLPDVPDLAVTTIRRLPADPARRRHSFQIELIAEREGLLTVPPFAVEVGGQSVLTSALRLGISAPRPATEMALAIMVEPTELRVGQPATLTVTWTSAVPLLRCRQLFLEIPLLLDERCQVFPLDPPVPEAERIGLPVNNTRAVAQASTLPDQRESLAFHFKLVPLEPCVLRTQPARLVCALLHDAGPTGESPGYFYNHFFEAAGDSEVYQRVYLTAPVPKVTARALTDAGRSARFSGVVGPCDLRTSLIPSQLLVGQPALLTVHLENLAFARHVARLPAAAFAGLRPEFQLTAEPIRESATDNSRSFTYILRPLRPGIAHIPAIVMQTFEPDSGEYRTLRSTPIPITVASASEDALQAVAPRPASLPPVSLNGVRHNRHSGEKMISPNAVLDFFGRYAWVFVPLPLVLWLALRPLARRWERCRRDPVYARAMTAMRRFRRTARRDEETAWRNYLADRLALCAEALTADSVTEALRARQVPEDLMAETRRRLQERDATDYGKRPAAPPQSIRRLVRRLHQVTAPLVLVCSVLIASQAGAAESADELFACALRMRGEKPDEAQALFIEAALCFEGAGSYLNAGNGWYFAGENGRALANYRVAERRSPFDRQLQSSIAFLRANRADAFPPPASPSGRLAAVWKRFCAWAPRLRIGLFVLVYLAAWTVFLITQLLGWRVHRMAWLLLTVSLCLPLASVIQTRFQPAEGVLIEDTDARLGPGYAYDPAFQQSLHKATEFTWLETRHGWVRARLPDNSEGWLRESDCWKVE
jgi:hypothetical protein